ncbi:MAG: glutamate formimidoyltransferase [Anaerolineales bacterium]|nr:MAG: glutamate formimidoyltransferase [Anaerolineales bacterium]
MPSQRLIECVPNFSEGRDIGIIREITGEIERVAGVQLLDIDPGIATNRTVITFMGLPEAVAEAAFAAIKTGTHRIDMRRHHGVHPRIGAVDVCPLVPYAGITMDETVVYARDLARRVGQALNIPVYCYGHAAMNPTRRNLATIRAGEYEGLAQKLLDPHCAPDFGPAVFNPKTGATVIGARDILIAYNVNLGTTDVAIAREIARDVRESGRIQRDPTTGAAVRDANGKPVRTPGSLKGVKAIGWHIPEYGGCQVSMNLTDIIATPMHIAFAEVCARAEARGVQVAGSELVGMVPLLALRKAGEYALSLQNRSVSGSPDELINAAIQYLGLDALAPFDPNARIIECALQKK